MKKTKESPDRQNTPNGFIMGLFFGAGLVFLFGTKEGQKFKKRLLEKGQETMDELPETVKKLQKEGEQFAKRAVEVKSQLESKIESFTPQAKTRIKAALDQVEVAQQRGRKAAQAAQKRFFTRRGKKVD